MSYAHTRARERDLVLFGMILINQDEINAKNCFLCLLLLLSWALLAT